MRVARAGLAQLVLVAALAVSAAGCARLVGRYDFAPSGLAAGEDQLRRMLATGQAGPAFTRFDTDPAAPDDDVLRGLYRGVLAYYAGDYAESARVLDLVSELADDRVTRSISRSALSVVTNDMALAYEPARTERLLIPFYAALARSRMGDASGAAVEARRLSYLLQRYEDDGVSLDPHTAATLRYVAGALFEANRDRADAEVAYRNARRLDSLLVAPAPAGDSGTVLVVLERGFVAHRVEQGLAVMLAPEEVDLITNGETDEKIGGAAFVAARVLRHAPAADRHVTGPYQASLLHVPEPEDRASVPRRRRKSVCADPSASAASGDSTSNGAHSGAPKDTATAAGDRREKCSENHHVDELPYLLKVAWPVYRSEHARGGRAYVVTAADTVTFATSADISSAVIRDFEAERALLVARTILRGTAKLALAKGAEKKLEEKNEAAGKLVGLLGNVSNVLLERADLRSWHLLPAGISLARVHLPAGEHRLTVQLGDEHAPFTLALDPVMVRSGTVAIMPVRAW